MASASGLASSQVLNKVDFNEYEDPGRAWIDLVLAFKSGNPEQVRSVLELAKKSHWTHDLYNDALIQAEELENSDDDWTEGEEFPNAQDPDYEL